MALRLAVLAVLAQVAARLAAATAAWVVLLARLPAEMAAWGVAAAALRPAPVLAQLAAWAVRQLPAPAALLDPAMAVALQRVLPEQPLAGQERAVRLAHRLVAKAWAV